jgi:hypothetical protein
VRPYTFVLKADAASREVRKREGRVAALTTGIGARKGRRARVLQGQAAAGLEARPLERFPDQVEDLSRRIEPCFGVMVRRDAAYLNWRFTDVPSGLHRRVGLFDGEELAAYVVVQVPRPGDAGGFLVDLLGRDEAAVRAAFGSGLEALEQAGASYAEATAMDGSWWAERLLENGFLPPKAENHLTVILHVHDAEHPLVAAAREPKRWYFTDGDRDDETMG